MTVQFDDRCLFTTLVFLNGLEDRIFYFTLVIGNQFCTSCKNFVRFGSVTPVFKTGGGTSRHCGDQ